MAKEEKDYRPLTIPQLAWQKGASTDVYGELIAQPLEPGFGVTLGNALRRTLLGGVEGSAVTSVIIKGANNEFAALPGVVEDVMQLALNIKGIVIKNTTGKSGEMRLRVAGESAATVGDIEADEHLELVNKDYVIANVASGGELDITFFVDSGRGYQFAQWPIEEAFRPDGRIYLDAMFSPIRQVTFDVEKTRVGKDIDYDRLILKIHTNGSEKPADALHYAVSVLRTQLEHFLSIPEIPFNEISVSPKELESQEPAQANQVSFEGIPVDLLLKPIEELELSVRAHNCLINAGIKRVIDLVNMSDDDVLKIKNFGRKSLTEVRDSVKSFGLSFGMNVDEDAIKKMVANNESS